MKTGTFIPLREQVSKASMEPGETEALPVFWQRDSSSGTASRVGAGGANHRLRPGPAVVIKLYGDADTRSRTSVYAPKPGPEGLPSAGRELEIQLR